MEQHSAWGDKTLTARTASTAEDWWWNKNRTHLPHRTAYLSFQSVILLNFGRQLCSEVPHMWELEK